MASGDTLAVFTPRNNTPPSSNYASVDTRNGHLVLDFDASTNESAVFDGVLDRSYSGGGVTVYIHYQMTSATSNTVDWDVAFERLEDTADTTSDGFAAANSVDNTTVPSTAGVKDIVSITFTDGADMNSVIGGDEFRIKVTRDASSDDATGDAELRKVEIKET